MRARVVMYNPETDAVLLIRRVKDGRDYWVVPGGGAKEGETPRQTAVREVDEELAVKLLPADLHILGELDEGERVLFFGIKVDLVHTPAIHGEEKARASRANVYEPTWVASAALTRINLMPPALAGKILPAVAHEFFK